MASATLSLHDSSILTALFDPESAPTKGPPTEYRGLSLPNISENDFLSMRKEEQEVLRSLDVQSPDASAIHNALAGLTRLIQANPDYPSAYANRAQATRLELQLDEIFTTEARDSSRRLLNDLSEAIRLATPAIASAPISPHQAGILAAAHTHRGLLLLRVADLKTRNLRPVGIGENLEQLESRQIEELASKDFFMGARYGNRTAQQLSVKTNPYAKMCGTIVKEALRKEIAESRPPSKSECVPFSVDR
jgi:hypothetical protein